MDNKKCLTHEAQPAPPSLISFKFFSQLCGLIVAGFGVVAIVGWLMGSRILTGIRADYIPMAPNTALSFIVFGISLIALITERKRGLKLSRLGAAMVFVLSLVRFTEISVNINLNVDQWIFQVPGEKLGLIPVGQMALPTALNFLFASVALFLASSLKRRFFVDALKSVLAGLTTFIGLAFSLGYIYGAPLLYGGTTIPMALNTAISFFVLGLGLVINNQSHDIAERKRAAEALRKAYNELEVRIAERTAELSKANEALRAEIIEHKRAAEALLASKARLNEAQRVAHIGSWELDLVTNTLTWSDEIYRIFEIDPKAFGASYEAFLDTVYPDDRAMVNKAYTDSVQNRTPYEIVHRLLTPDGRVKFVHEHCKTHYAPDGKPVRSIGTAQDITERRHAERMLEESEKKYRTLIETAFDGIHLLDLEGNFIFVNKQYCKMLGYSKEELMVKNFGDTLPPSKRKEGIELFKEIIKEKLHFSMYEGKNLKKDGSLIDVQIKWSFMYEDGKVNAVLGIVRDVTERKREEKVIRESEERFRLLTESSLTGVYLIQDNIFRYINPALASIFGYRIEELIDKLGPLDLTSHEDRALVTENIRKRVKGVVRDIRYSFKGLRKDRIIIDIETHGARVEYNGRPAIIGTLLDITERKRVEKAIRVSEERYKLLLRSVTDYIYTVKVKNGRAVATSHGPACVSVTGYTAEEYEADPYLWYRMTYEEDRKTVIEQANRILSG